MREKEAGITNEAVLAAVEEERKEDYIADFMADSLAELAYFQKALDSYQRSFIENGVIEFADSFDLGRAFTIRMIPRKWRDEPLTNDGIKDAHNFLFDENNNSSTYIGRAFIAIDKLSPSYNDWLGDTSDAISNPIARLDFILGGMTTVLAFHIRELSRMGIDPYELPED